MHAIAQRVLIAYGSESGNAKALAEGLAAAPCVAALQPQVMPLNDVDLQASWGDEALLLIISSSFGDGEPPGNAEGFLAQLRQSGALAQLRYAIFGLGDTAYPNFCGFTKQLDALLQERGAQAIINRVDADIGYADFFARWQPVLEQVLQGDAQAGLALSLRVIAYGENDAYAAAILERRQLNQAAPDAEPGAYHIRLACEGSGMRWRAGDTLHVLAQNDPQLLAQLAQWYGAPEAAELLRDKELRQISKGVLRELARLGGSDALKGLLKFSQRQQLEQYLWGADVLDVLQDFCTPEKVPLAELAQLLSPRLPRAYSIASHGQAGHIDLCIRHVRYERQGRQREGMATHWLLTQGGPVQVYCRANPGFHLAGDAAAPLILIGTGTGIAPLMGLLRELQASGQPRQTCLFFGEKRQAQDFLYREELESLQAEGVLHKLVTAFSRDGAEKYYVQHALQEHAGTLRDWIAQGAHVYVCGNKQHLERAIGAAFDALLADTQQGAADPDETPWQRLVREGRVHLELY